MRMIRFSLLLLAVAASVASAQTYGPATPVPTPQSMAYDGSSYGNHNYGASMQPPSTPTLLSSTPVYRTISTPGPTQCHQANHDVSTTTGIGSLLGAAAGYRAGGGGRDPFGAVLGIAVGSAIGNAIEPRQTYIQTYTECVPTTVQQSVLSHYATRTLIDGQIVDGTMPAPHNLTIISPTVSHYASPTYPTAYSGVVYGGPTVFLAPRHTSFVEPRHGFYRRHHWH